MSFDLHTGHICSLFDSVYNTSTLWILAIILLVTTLHLLILIHHFTLKILSNANKTVDEFERFLNLGKWLEMLCHYFCCESYA